MKYFTVITLTLYREVKSVTYSYFLLPCLPILCNGMGNHIWMMFQYVCTKVLFVLFYHCEITPIAVSENLFDLLWWKESFSITVHIFSHDPAPDLYKFECAAMNSVKICWLGICSFLWNLSYLLPHAIMLDVLLSVTVWTGHTTTS